MIRIGTGRRRHVAFIAMWGLATAFARAAAAETTTIAVAIGNGERAAALRALYTIEDPAEAVAERETKGKAAMAASRRARARWRTARRLLSAIGASTNDLRATEGAIGRLRIALGQPSQLPRAANDVTGTLAPLFALAGDRFPADVHILDYLGRSILLDASVGQWDRGDRDARDLARAWIRFRPAVATKATGGSVTRSFDAAIRSARDGVRKRNRSDVQRTATLVGNAVDAVEGLYP